jgi:hypothetical protein
LPTDSPTEKTHTTTKGDVHQKSTEQAGRQRYRNGDNHARRNQVAAGYERRDEEGYGNKEFQARGKHDAEIQKYSGPSAEDMLYRPC